MNPDSPTVLLVEDTQTIPSWRPARSSERT
jgi:hypothetical protein